MPLIKSELAGGRGGEHRTNLSLVKHNGLISFLEQNEKDIWVAPLLEIAEFVLKYQKDTKL